jgi:hypothetical protein
MKTPTPTQTLLLSLVLCPLLFAAAACGPTPDPPSLIETTRVLGARVEVAGAPDRASPKPGESVSVSWLMTAPGDMPPLSWAFVLCTGDGSSLDCAGQPLAVLQGQGVPMMTVEVPSADALGGAKLLVLEGRVCASSSPTVDSAGRPSCTMDGDGTTASVAIALDLDQAGYEANDNPALAASPAWLDGQPWDTTATPSPDDGCAGLPVVAPDTTAHVLGLGTTGADRETFTGLAGDPPAPAQQRESLQISQFTTAGKLDHSFAYVESTDPSDAPVTEVKWDAPKAADVPAGGMLVRFLFVARDGRGGVGWTGRELCVVR